MMRIPTFWCKWDRDETKQKWHKEIHSHQRWINRGRYIIYQEKPPKCDFSRPSEQTREWIWAKALLPCRSIQNNWAVGHRPVFTPRGADSASSAWRSPATPASRIKRTCSWKQRGRCWLSRSKIDEVLLIISCLSACVWTALQLSA